MWPLLIYFQNILIIRARPSDCGCGGGFPVCGGFGGGIEVGGGEGFCGPPPFIPQPSPPVSFVPVPQPVPIRIPSPRPQSVTIPNIILALLPPNNKPIVRPRPIIRPSPPAIIPIPQPYPYPIRPGCDSEYTSGPVIGGGGIGGSIGNIIGSGLGGGLGGLIGGGLGCGC